jgi:hypothetical protein
MPDQNELHDFRQGDFLEAADLNALVAAARRLWTGPNMAFDVDGYYQRPAGGAAGDTLKPFELKTALVPGGSAEAYPRKGNAEIGYTTQMIPTGTTTTYDEYGTPTVTIDGYEFFTVYDPLGLYRGREKDKFPSPNEDGSRGWAKMVDGKWVITEMQNHAQFITGKAAGGITADQKPFDISDATPTAAGELITNEDPGEDFAVTNRRFEGDSGEKVVAMWVEADEVYYAIDVMCPEEE